jgi:signal transduction histidine kinase
VEGVKVEATSRRQTAVAADNRDLAARYADALEAYVFDPDESGLVHAHDLGREALDQRLGVLATATMHSQALAAVMKRPLRDRDRANVCEAAERFAIEALSPFEMAHHGYWEANLALHRLNELLEAQARRIAATLHDEASQLLAAVHFSLAELALRLAPEQAAEVRAARQLLDQTEERLRGLAHELRPPVLHQHGLIAALRFLADATSKRWGLTITVHGDVDRSIPATVETTIYRIVQEAVTNAAKHGRATTVAVQVSRSPKGILCAVRDDGVGFPGVSASGNSAPGLGLIQIKEQAAALGGTVRFGANAPRGAELIVDIPLSRSRLQ